MKLTVINEKREKSVDESLPRVLRLILKVDFIQLIPMFFLLSVGLFYIYTTGQQVGGNPDIWKRQLFYITLGIGIWAFLAYIDYKIWSQWAILIYAAGVISLVLVFYLGVERYGAKRWFSIFGLVSVQPSEFAKIATIMLSAWVSSLRNFNMHNLKHLAGFVLITAIPFTLIYMEPDFGSCLILLPVVGGMVFAGRIKWKWIITAIVILMIAAPSIYPFLRDYQKKRILVFLDPSSAPTNEGWNSRQSQLAVGSGGFWGKGISKNTQSTLGFLPKTVANSDFIFSVIAEETGFVGSSIVILSYLLLVFSAFRTAIIASDEFGRYLAVGIGTLIFIHSAVNIGMTIRLMPVTGLPLPLVSLGGSFIISTMVALGLLQSIYIRSNLE